MELKLKQIIISETALKELAEIKLRAAISYKIAKTLRLIGAELEDFNKVRAEKAKEYGTPDEKGQQYTFEPDNMAKFNEEMGELIEKDVALSGLEKIKLVDLGEAELSSAALVTLDWLIEE